MFDLNLKTKHFLTGEELSKIELLKLLDQAIELKKSRRTQTLKDKTVALVFEKPSLRTRVSFTVGVQELGGNVIELTSTQKKKETPEDSIRVLQGYVQGAMVRTFEHEILEKMTSVSSIPIINGLSDLHHPCQVLADLQTLKENFGELKGLKLAYIGDGNNMLHSLLLLLPFLGVDVHFACPKGFQPDAKILKRAMERAKKAGASIQGFATPELAVAGVNAIYTDVWTSMGFEAEGQKREKAFKGYQINSGLYKKASPNAIIMHCMPVDEGKEITREMIEHKNSVLFQQSENRLHAQKALLMGLFAKTLKKTSQKNNLKETSSWRSPHKASHEHA